MSRPLTDDRLAEIASRAHLAQYFHTFHGDHSKGSTWWRNAAEDLLDLVAEVKRLRVAQPVTPEAR